MIKLDIRVGETFTIGDGVTVRLDRKSGQIARLAIEAGPDVRVERQRSPLPPLQTPSEEFVAKG
ncbi:carbon storage regulator [Sphingobium cupriresistens]|uniref:carbon storage regulator n=1 Tax=Sphingobium cupriresistens TaxID=1132417 RepID=UPI003BF6101C